MRKSYAAYLFLLPAFIGIFIFKLYPILHGFIESLHTHSFLQGGKKFVGFDNYTSLFVDSEFWNSLKVTLLLNVIINPVQIILAFLLALFLNSKIKGIGVFRAIHYVPISVAIPVAVVIWTVLLNPEQGVINSILVELGIPAQSFFMDKDQALWSVMLLATWKGVGYWAIFLLAGLQEIPQSLYESSSIDGANKWNQTIKIVIPMMKRPLMFVTVSCTVANFLLFAPMYLLTKGGPDGSTNVLMYESFNYAFVYSDMGKATAIVMILLLIILLVISFQFKFLKSDH